MENTIVEELRAKFFIDKIKKIHLQVQEAVNNSQEKKKERHDQQRVEKTFKVGDRVWFHLNKEIQQSPSKKIKELWYGPFEVSEKVGGDS